MHTFEEQKSNEWLAAFQRAAKISLLRDGKNPPTLTAGWIYWDAVKAGPAGPCKPIRFTDIDLAGEVADAFNWHHGGHESSSRRWPNGAIEYSVWSKGPDFYLGLNGND
jgi:hypothetical protein